MSKLPEKIELNIHGETIEFSLTDKREIKYYGKSKTSNESLWRIDKLDDTEVFYQTEWGWGIFVIVKEHELSLEERYNLIEKDKHTQFLNWQNLGTDRIKEILDEKNIPARLITVKYKGQTITTYE